MQTKKIIQYSDFQLEVEVEGSALPNDVYIVIGGQPIRLNKKNAANFSHRFTNLQNDVSFYLTANGYDSKKYKLDVLSKPLISAFKTLLNYPNYTGIQDEELNNIGNIEVPIGTYAKWIYNVVSTDSVEVFFEDRKIKTTQQRRDQYQAQQRIMSNGVYTIYVSNKDMVRADSAKFEVQVIPDEYPTIEVEEIKDSNTAELTYFIGDIEDDYGFNKLEFIYTVFSNDKKNAANSESILLEIEKN